MNAIAPDLSAPRGMPRKQLPVSPGSGATSQPGWHDAFAAFKGDLMEHALRSAGGKRTRAARLLGLPE